MVLRAILLFFVIGCVLFMIFTNNVKSKHFLVLIICTISIMLVYTYSTAHITVKSYCNQNLTIENIVDNFCNNNSLNSVKREYVTEKNSSIEFSNFTYLKYSFDEKPSNRDLYDIIYNFYVERGYMCGLDITDKIIFKMLTPILTSNSIKEGVSFWFLPTIMQPYNPNSYLIKGCFYAEYYYNVFAWYQEGYLNVVYERCSSDIGKTDEQNLVKFIKDIK